MTTSLSLSNNACQRAIQFLLAIIMILIVGKLITRIPVMGRLQIADTFVAAEIVWFGAKLSALVLFFYFARATIAAIPNGGGTLSFLRSIAEPLTVLVIVIIGQELLWQLLKPFVQGIGETVYFGIAVSTIVAVSIWLVFKGYLSAPYLVETSRAITTNLSQFVSSSKKKCLACGENIFAGSKFCSHCGHEIVVQDSCSECGKKLFANEQFCRYCGTEVKEKTNPSSTELNE